MRGFEEVSLRDCLQFWLPTVVDDHREARGVVACPIVEAVGLNRVLPERERPTSCDIVVPGTESLVRVEARQSNPREIDQCQRPTRLDSTEAESAEVACGDYVRAVRLAKGLDEGAVRVAAGVQCAELPCWGVETIVDGPPEVERRAS